MRNIKWFTAAVIVVVLSSSVLAGDEAFDFKASAEAASAHVFRGSTLNDGAVLQPSVEASIYFLTIGAWVNFDINDYKGAIDEFNLSQKDLYAKCDFKISDFNLGVGYRMYMDKYVYVLPQPHATREEALANTEADLLLRQTYPRPELAVDDASEVSLSIALESFMNPSLTIYYGMDGCLEDMNYVVAGFSHDYYKKGDWGMGIAGSLTYLDQSAGESGLSHFTFTHKVNYKIVTATITYISPFGYDVLPHASEGGPMDIRAYGSVGFTRRF